jgi:23S rRNA (uracil1939-C5)-methyltransferase
VASWIPDGSRVLEFHAGCGALGLGRLGRVAHMAFNEVAPPALEGLAMGLGARPAAERERTTVLPGAAADHVAAVPTADVVIVDPPRRGLDDALLAALVPIHPPG